MEGATPRSGKDRRGHRGRSGGRGNRHNSPAPLARSDGRRAPRRGCTSRYRPTDRGAGKPARHRPLRTRGGEVPRGTDWYALQLERSLGSMTPAYAERRLYAELSRLQARAADLFDSVGAPKASIGDRYARLWRDERFLYPDTDDGRARAVADMNRMLGTARAHIRSAFGEVPPWSVAAGARALTTQEMAAGRGGYRDVPTPTRPGTYVVDLKEIRRRPRWTLPSVVAHELLPGHMIQLGLEGARPPHPLRVDYAAAFVEGWGIYAEQLADRTGAYADAHDALGHVHWLIFRVARALVDLGIHLHGWSIERARDRLIEWQGEPAYFAPFDVELARISLEPAARVAEAMAWLTMADHGRNRPPIAYARALLFEGRKRMTMNSGFIT
ncbi:DUF885 family protein [Sphingomonas aurantiaca]|uniref:DUF885 family protein n=1 Tax=Sphingomonas aurantiaca TaxID=185949 RepID=UPI002FDFF531